MDTLCSDVLNIVVNNFTQSIKNVATLLSSKTVRFNNPIVFKNNCVRNNECFDNECKHYETSLY